MTESNEYTIGEAASLLGVTAKALRHWDGIGLLSPAWRTWSDYRVYMEDDLELGAAIVLYKEAGMKLADIQLLLDDSSASTIIRALTEHRTVLLDKQKQLRQQLDQVTALITKAEQGEIVMSDMAKYLNENVPKYQEEARQRWRNTPEWSQSQAKMTAMKESDWADINAKQEAFAVDLARAKADGVAPGSPEALELVEKQAELEGIDEPSWD